MIQPTTRVGWRGLLSVALVFVVITAIGAGAGGISALDQNENPGDTGPILPDSPHVVADEAIISEDGDVVFVYRQSLESPTRTMHGELGIEAATGMGYAFLTGEFSPGMEPEATGTMETSIDTDIATSRGEIAVSDPESLEYLSTSAHVSSTEEMATTEFELAAVIAETDRPYQEATTAGEIVATADTVTGSGAFGVAGTNGEDRFALDERRELTLVQTERGYELESTVSRSVGAWERERWETRADAKRSLETRYDEIAIAFGGEATLELTGYEYDDDPRNRSVDLAYRVTLVDVEEGFAERLVGEIDRATAYQLSESERRVLADRLLDVTIEELAIGMEQDGLDTAVEWSVELDGTDAIALGLAEVAGASEDDRWVDRYDDVRAAIDAQQAAEFAERTTWDVTMTHHPDSELTTAEAHLESAATGWETYVEELEERGLDPIRGMTVAEHEAQLGDDEDLVLGYDIETSEHALAIETTEHAMALFDVEAALGFEPTRLSSMSGEDFEMGHLEVEVGEDAFEIESASLWEEGGTIDVLEETAVTAVYVDVTDEQVITYLVAPGAVEPEPTNASIREHPNIGEETDLTFPTEWEESHPSIDETIVRGILGMEDADERNDTMSIAVTAGGIILMAVFGGWLYRRRQRS